MSRRKSASVLSTVALAAFAVAGSTTANAVTHSPTGLAHTAAADTTHPTSYVVLAADGVSAKAVAAGLRAKGVKVTGVNEAAGMVTASSTSASFRRTATSVHGVDGVAADRSIGRTPSRTPADVEREHAAVAKAVAGLKASRKAVAATATADPLDDKLWGMQMIKADKAHAVKLGDKRVKVGVIDTGVDADAPRHRRRTSTGRLSRNFATDIPAIDGAVRGAPAASTRSARTTAATARTSPAPSAPRLNGFGLSASRPNVTLVELRAGQDSGYFFLDPVVNALTYAGDVGHRRGQHVLLRRPVALQLHRRRTRRTHPEQAADSA